MISQDIIVDFCSKYDYDLKKPSNARWIDQKCAPDVVTTISDCIYNYWKEHRDVFFTSKDIWHSKYAIDNIEAIFKKPGVESAYAKNEYNKFFQQPMEMLAYAKVLSKEKRGDGNHYKINRLDILEYIAIRERNALIFLQIYIEKVLKDTGLFYLFDRFFELQTKGAYKEMKKGYSDFIINNTPINGEIECNRIFIKVLNPLAYKRNAKGTERGYISSHIITYDMLMYNRNNFRDICADKPKSITRKEYAAIHQIDINDAYYRYQSAKAKRFLRDYNDTYRHSKPEYMQGAHVNDKAIHMHHIFPEADYPELCYFIENIIALTPTQHLSYAHPNGNTKEIDEQYQHLLLLAKSERIRENLSGSAGDIVYEFRNFLYVLHIGFDNDEVLNIDDMDFTSVVNVINVHYAKNSYSVSEQLNGYVAEEHTVYKA